MFLILLNEEILITNILILSNDVLIVIYPSMYLAEFIKFILSKFPRDISIKNTTYIRDIIKSSSFFVLLQHIIQLPIARPAKTKLNNLIKDITFIYCNSSTFSMQNNLFIYKIPIIKVKDIIINVDKLFCIFVASFFTSFILYIYIQPLPYLYFTQSIFIKII